MTLLLFLRLGAFFCLLLLGVNASASAQDLPVAEDGVLDLKNWRIDLQPSLPLAGEWLRYPGRLLAYDDLARLPIPGTEYFPAQLLRCDKASDTDQHQPSRPCVATFVLELRQLPAQPLAIRIPELSTAFRLSWNGQVIREGGQVSTDPALFRSYVGHHLVSLPATGRGGVLVLQVANLKAANGVSRQLVLGDAAEMRTNYAQAELLEALSAAIAGIGGILLLLQQKARRRYEKGLWGLGLFSFVVLTYILTEGFTVLRWFVSEPEWGLVTRINITCQSLFAPALLIWLGRTYPGMFPGNFKYLTGFIVLIWAPLLLIVPASWLVALESPNMLLSLVIGVMAFLFLIRYRYRHRDRQLDSVLISLILVLIPALHDVMLYQGLIRGADWLPIGFVGFIVAQIFLLAVKRARQHAHLDALNQELFAGQTILEETLKGHEQTLQKRSDELDTLQSELRFLRRYDGLTGLMRQDAFLEQSRQIVQRCTPDETVSLIVLDIDRYKHVGAMFGPLAADQALKNVAGLITQWSDSLYLCARLEGESFALLIPGMSEDEAIQEAEWLRMRISQRSVTLDHPAEQDDLFHITASFGVCALDAGEINCPQMIDAAETALNRAKKQGRNCVVGFSSLQQA